jgi:hypothetical protein
MAGAGRRKGSELDSVFNLLALDLMAGLDPATREIAQSRLFAERAFYVTQKLPTLLRWQTELLSLNATRQPAAQEAIASATQISAAVTRLAAFAERLPAQISAERREVLLALEAQEAKLTPLVNEVRQTLAAGGQMSVSLNTTLTTFDALMKRFGVGEPGAATAATNAEPFRIQDYGEAAARFEATARELTGLLVTLDKTLGSTNLLQLSAQVSPAVQQAQTRARDLVDYAVLEGRPAGDHRGCGLDCLPRRCAAILSAAARATNLTMKIVLHSLPGTARLGLVLTALLTGCAHLCPQTIPAP